MKDLYQEFDDAVYSMENKALIFYAAMKMGRPLIDNGIKTACVTFDVSSGKYLDFHFNPTFWNYLSTENNRSFVIAHECLHVIMGHGMRTLCESKSTREDREIMNIALDLIINHTLVDYFKFERTKELEALCWIDTVFEKPDDIDRNGTFEYYFNLLKDPKNRSKDFKKLADHAMTTNSFLEDFGNELSEAINDDMAKQVSYDDVENLLKRSNNRNSGKPGDPLIEGKTNEYLKSKPKINKKWSELVLKYNKIGEEDYDVEQWSHRGRRHANLDPSLMLPSDRDDTRQSSKRITVYFFLDASGSCWHLRHIFLNACKSLDPKRFVVKAFTRTTVAKEIDIRSDSVKWVGGGGSDDFSCMERCIQKEIADGKLAKYPDAIFHITDGNDCAINPFKRVENPDVWHWFLTGPSARFSIPDGCHIHKLKDFLHESDKNKEYGYE